MNNDEMKPQIRFKEFTDAWEQRKFGDLVTLRRGLTYSPNDVSKTGIKVLRSSNISEDTFIENEDDVFVTNEAATIEAVKQGDIFNYICKWLLPFGGKTCNYT